MLCWRVWCIPKFQHTAARRRLDTRAFVLPNAISVSTHSRPKAAGVAPLPPPLLAARFNTQPPEGGWGRISSILVISPVSTHSRPKAAGIRCIHGFSFGVVSTHSRPKAAGRLFRRPKVFFQRFNTQPPEGGWQSRHGQYRSVSGFNTQPPEGGWFTRASQDKDCRWFQHTAARRRLERRIRRRLAGCRFNTQPPEGGWV